MKWFSELPLNILRSWLFCLWLVTSWSSSTSRILYSHWLLNVGGLVISPICAPQINLNKLRKLTDLWSSISLISEMGSLKKTGNGVSATVASIRMSACQHQKQVEEVEVWKALSSFEQLVFSPASIGGGPQGARLPLYTFLKPGPLNLWKKHYQL